MNEKQTMDNNEPQNTKVSLSMRMDPALFSAVSDLAVAEDRSLSNMIERLLKLTPQIQEIIGTEPATAAVGN